MRTDTWLRQAETRLKQAGIVTARLDALVLLEDTAGKDRAWLLAHPEFALSTKQTTALDDLVTRRAQHEPLAYLRGHTEFYGRDFVLSPAVLEPRPESETMIDLLKDLCRQHFDTGNQQDPLASTVLQASQKVRIADVGTGCGALGITAALELPKATVTLFEIDAKALQIAQTNVDKFTLPILALESNLLAVSTDTYDVLLCNLPYVPDTHTINTAAMQEPPIAIFGGPDGLDIYRQLFEQIRNRASQPLFILTEALPPQHHALATIARHYDYVLAKTDDFIQLFELSSPSS